MILKNFIKIYSPYSYEGAFIISEVYLLLFQKKQIMVKVGRYNALKVIKTVDFGVYLDGEDKGEILLPARYIPENCRIGDIIDVFIYFDSEDRIIATTEKPYIQVGEFAYLKVKSTNRVGAFLDWGLMKDLLVPFREQRVNMKQGYYYTVYAYLDHESGRIVASAKLNKFLNNLPIDYEINQEVDLLVVQETEIGYKVIINNTHWGMVYYNEIFCNIEKGDHIKGYIKHIREDENIDVVLQPVGYEKIDTLSSEILRSLHENEGYMPLSDKSSAEQIAEHFSCSKKNFKKAIGALYKQRLILILENGIRLNEK